MTQPSALSQHRPGGAFSGVRRAAVVAVVISLVIAAVIGIITLLTQEWGQLQSQVLLTALIFAAFSVVLLIVFSSYSVTPPVISVLALLAASVALVSSLLSVWEVFSYPDPAFDVLLKVLMISWLFSAAFVHSCLVLRLAARQNTLIRLTVWVSTALVAFLVLLTTSLIVTDGKFPDLDFIDRVYGVGLILLALSTIVLPILAKLNPEDGATVYQKVVVNLLPEHYQELSQRSSAQGLSPEEYLRNGFLLELEDR